jgi:uncharacterized protein
VFTLADRAQADLIVLGGDLCGKGLVPIVVDNGSFSAEFLEQTLAGEGERELAEVERRIRFSGFYTVRCDRDELERLAGDAASRETAFRSAMVTTVERWLEIADDRLKGTGTDCVVIPGNDDDWAIDAALDNARLVSNCDGRLVQAGDLNVIGLGLSNVTPWNSPREVAEETLAERLAGMLARADPDLPVVANIHVPPYNSGLDTATFVKPDMHAETIGGSPVVGPVGSRAVRDFLEGHQPTVSLHGHVHESRGVARIRGCVAINPGSDYSSGTLQAAVVSVDTKKKKVRGHQFVSG